MFLTLYISTNRSVLTMNTRDKIIQCSAELFNTYGYNGCSLSDIMQATQLKKGGIYNHFKSKDEIAIEAFNHNYDKVINRFKQQLAAINPKDPIDKLYKVIDVFASFADDPVVKGGGCPIFNTAMDATNSHPELRRKAKIGIKGLKVYIELKLKEAIESNYLNGKLNPEEIASLFVMTLEGAIVMSRVNENTSCVGVASKYLKEFIKNNLVMSS